MASENPRPGAKDTMAQPKFKVGDKVRNTNGDVIGVVAEMWTDNNSEPVYRLVDESKRGIGQFKERHLIRASRPGAKDTMAVEDRFYFGKGRKERFGASDKVDGLIATAYRALRNGDKAAARRLIASAEALVQSDSSVPNYIVNELKDLKKSLRF